MKKLLRKLRFAGAILLLLLSAAAVGLTGHFLPITRERYEDKRTTTGQVDKKREKEDIES
jgi:hypothetical protein